MKHLSLFFLLVLLFNFSINAQGPPPVGCPITVWNGSSWSNITGPNLGIEAIIDGDYDTNLLGIESFTCCQLTINAPYTLTIAPSNYVEVRTIAKINGNLIVQHQGSFVQKEDLINAFIVGPTGSATVNKSFNSTFSTAVKLWSSPIKGETIDETFTNTPSFGGYRYYYKTENFQDLTYEENNNNATNPGIGVDGIDDGAPFAWNFAYLNLPVESGVGYITRQAPGSAGIGTFNYAFDGEFNNGYIEVPITRNDANLSPPAGTAPGNDNNNVFIGNPYASAISLEAFLLKNTYDPVNNTTGILDGCVALWSASAPPISNNNGNESLNYSVSDYFYMNFSGPTLNVCESLPFTTCAPDAGGTPSPTPDPSISSAQGFFANFSDDIPSMSPLPTTGKVIFNNAMRIVDLNENFYKTSSSSKSTPLSNKLWLNLNSSSGINENILLSYVNGATSANDGRSYDLDLDIPYAIPYSLIYFNIDESEEKFRIQGKNPSDLNSNEEVSLGFYNSIEAVDAAPEEFAISITQFQGEFIQNRTTFLVDNLLNVCHNLTDSPYFFTSEVGEFNERFKIVFQSCDYSEACNVIFDAFAGSIAPQGKCGKYRIKAPKGDYKGYNVVLTHQGTDINVPTNGANTTFLYTENGNYIEVLSIFDEETGELCYRGDVELVVDCFKDKKTLSIYPNPARDTFNVRLNNTSEQIERTVLRNLMGIIVKQSNANSMRITSLKPGVYFVEVTSKTGKTYRKQLVVK
ncbi:T9SS type A sorting domain-containing protein [Lacinutrix sp. Hel_I_90]|uniref:T9SS type A sorting domain-containing protein n=1 Tax=Lacinutrix sp. Hel_I_90 TaxID=1249999 RepID=UPI0005CABD8D|nr:T9SS type A sorting domain-containing protein [Lacinutrix sp. Hel_I_90]